ncbi:hypothetical protein FSP39_015072 [Pinctada imbricata]|uniref:Uncharacterized protein n=1 Tax=Pinctada imbricata TaxID=66713 RepID=A0AA88XDE8_PINIB|nr:hypothetical protein FSP39_015072 [Pinctada imbricata]
MIVIILLFILISPQMLQAYSSWTESWNITRNGDLIGKPWGMCVNFNQSLRLQRILIQRSQHDNYFFQCTKLIHSWNGTAISRNERIKVICPSQTDHQTMCVSANIGIKDDIGYLYIVITGETGISTEVGSEFIILKNRKYPQLDSVCVDKKNRKISLDMDFVEDEIFSTSVYYTNMLLCNLQPRKCNSIEQKACRDKLDCFVAYEMITHVLKIHGESVKDHVTVLYHSKNLNRNVSTSNILVMTDSCLSEENGSNKGAVIGIVITVILLITVVAHTYCKPDRLRKQDTEHNGTYSMKGLAPTNPEEPASRESQSALNAYDSDENQNKMNLQ